MTLRDKESNNKRETSFFVSHIKSYELKANLQMKMMIDIHIIYY